MYPDVHDFCTTQGQEGAHVDAEAATEASRVALAEAHQVVNVHISSLLGVFLTPELNPVWNDRLVEQRLLYLNGIRHAYQVYEMPCANSSH